MNHYGLLAQEHWRRHAPQRYAALEDSMQFFTQLGETASAQIADLAFEMERGLPANLPFLDKVGQMRVIRKQAEEVVLSELIYSVTESLVDDCEQLEEMLGQLPSPGLIEDALHRLEDEIERGIPEFTSSLPTEEQTERQRRLEELLPLVTLDQEPEEMTAEQVLSRIQALRPFLPAATS